MRADEDPREGLEGCPTSRLREAARTLKRVAGVVALKARALEVIIQVRRP
jgi:hypothetical protein